MAGFNAAVAFSVFNIAASVLHQVDRLQRQYCDEDVNTSFMSDCKLLGSNPGRFLEVMGSITFRQEDGQYCLSQKIQKKSIASLTVSASAAFDTEPECCSSVETEHIATGNGCANPAERADAIFASIGNRTLGGFSFYEVIPDSCSKGAGCPLVVEISGAGGHPWAIALSLCKRCKREMKVVMIAPILGAGENTGTDYVMTIVDWVSTYMKESVNSTSIDHKRVYLASVSRGNEIAIQAAIYGAHIFNAAVLTGKFKVPGTFKETWRRNGDHFFTGTPQLRKVIFNIGDEDDVLTDKEFYRHFHDMTTVIADAFTPPTVDLFLYRGSGHDITWTTWNERYNLLWTGRD